MVEYDAWGKRALPMTPLRFDSAGDPPVILSKPIGYHTAEIMKDYGYTDDQIKAMDEDGAVVVYKGEEIEDRIFVSKRQAEGAAPCNW